MSISFTINGNVYHFPQNRESPSWGAEVMSWAQGVTNALTTVIAPNDVVPTSFPIGNNVTSPASIVGLVFDPLQVRGAVIYFSVYRAVTGGVPAELVEVGQLILTYKSVAGTWDIVPITGGSAGVTWTVTSGQVQYTSSNLPVSGGTHSGLMSFRAVALNQT